MKRFIIFFFLFSTLLLQIGAEILFIPEDSLDIDRENWTEEQYEQYEDSILNIFYPPLQIAEQEKPGNDDCNTSTPGITTRGAINNYIVPNSITLDYSKTVGEIPIYSGMSPTGAKTYEVPIKLCPGLKDFMPNLSLVYNSQQGNSVIGTGWSLSGLDMITRTPKSIYYDGAADGIKMDNTDGFALNGIRLIRLNQMGDFILYETETGNIKVKGYFDGDVMKYFEVFYPNGNKGVFGYETNSLNKSTYPQMSLTDLRGNSISFIYFPFGNHYHISDIYYSGGHVEFEYASSRIDTILAYIGGQEIEESRLLKRIISKRFTDILGTYTLSYDTLYRRSLLSQIDYEAGGSSLNPLRFYYGETRHISSYDRTVTQLPKYYIMPTFGSVYATFGRCRYQNGDDALIVYPNKVAYYDRKIKNKHIYRNKYTGNENIFIYSNLCDSVASIDSLKTGIGFVEVVCADLTGSQQEDIIKVRNKMASGQDSVYFEVYTINTYGQISLKYTRRYSFGAVFEGPNNYKSVRPKTFHVGDYNGDGKMEMLVMCGQPFSGCTYYLPSCHIFDLENNQILYQNTLLSTYELHFIGEWETDPQVIANGNDRLVVCDYDGDGKSDLYNINSTGTHVYTFQINNSGLSSTAVNADLWLNKSRLANSDFLVGDFNGDGLTDMFVTAPISAADTIPSLVFNSKGDGTLSRHESGYLQKNSSYDFGLITQDVNSDGIADIVGYGVGGFGTYITFSNRPLETNYSAAYPSSGRTKLIPANISSRNSFTTLISIKDGIVALYELPLNNAKEVMVTGMANSLGVIEKNRYRRITEDGESVMMPTQPQNYQPTYPFIEIHEPLLVLDRSELFVNGAMADFNKYGYGSAVFHRQGLGFRGFNALVRNDSRGRMFAQCFDPEQFGVMTWSDTPDYEGTYNYNVTVSSLKIAKIRLSSKLETDKQRSVSSQTTYINDTYGYPTLETTNFPNNGNITISKANTYQSNTSVNDGYHLGYLTTQLVTTSMGGNSYSEKTYYPYNSYRRPIVEVYSKNGHQFRQVINTYDTNGQKTVEKVTEYSSPNVLQTAYSYTSYGQLQSTTNPLNLTTHYYYDNVGRINRIQDERGGNTYYSYNAMGQEVSATMPDGTVRTTTRDWSSNAPGALYSITTTETGKPTTIAYYDALNREVRISDERFDGSYRHIDKSYDNYGRLSAVSLPFKNSSASYWNSYSYDNFDRITSIAEASGRTTSYSYSGLSTTTTEDGIATTRTYNVLGYLVSSEDPGGTITYDLALDGQPNCITAPGNITTTFTYDSYRRRTSITDPSSGMTTYDYDDEDENRLYKTDAKGNTTTYIYDQFNRVETIIRPEFTTTHTYTNGDLTSVSSTNGTSKQMTYDSYGRISSLKETVGDHWLQKDYYYSQGRVDSIRYTSQRGFLVSENYIYNHGHFVRGDINGSKTVFNLTSENVLGLPTSSYALNVSRTYEYTPFGYPSLRAATYSPLNNIRSLTDWNQSISYVFNPATSNLTSRTNNVRNLSESFSYDGLNRLTSYNHGASATYDTKGNITSKSDVGSFTYGISQKPYAISQANLNSNQLDTSLQNITYNSLQRPATISQGTHSATFTYNDNGDRMLMATHISNINYNSQKYYMGGCYESRGNQEFVYLFGDYYKAPAIFKKLNSSRTVYSILRDHLGTITHVIKENGYLEQELSYDAWGRKRSPYDWHVYTLDADSGLVLGRGYCGHEHLQEYGLVNMNARLYDPALGRFLSPDPYVQMPDNTQSFNRYSYCLNNPLKYVDEDGKYWWIAVAGAVIGAYMGGTLANGSYNPAKWDYGSVLTWGYMYCGGLIGAASSYAGAAVSAAGFAGANTAGILAASAINSLGTYAYTLGETPISVSAGAFSYDFTNREFGYLGKKGNSKIENAGYAFGALANLQDAVTLISGGGKNIMINSAGTNKDDWYGHSSITDEDENILVSVGPQSQVQKGESLSQTWKNSIKEANLQWPTHLGEKGTWSVGINGVSTNAISNYVSNVTRWDLLLNSCVGHASRALWKAGIPNLYLFHPHLLNAQLVIRQLGISSSPYLYNIP